MEYFKETSSDFLNEVELIGDAHVSRGGAVVETESGNLDAQIEEQLSEIEKSLKLEIVKPEEAEG